MKEMIEEVLPPLECSSAELSEHEGQAPSMDRKSRSSNINWALTYSSDEESQESQGNPWNRRASSDCSLTAVDTAIEPSSPVWNSQQQEPHRRPRSNANRLHGRNVDEDGFPIGDDGNDSDDSDASARARALSRTNLRDAGISILFCTPVRVLFGLFIISCYTTFWLPYPEIRPQVTHTPRFQHVLNPLGVHHKMKNNTFVAASSTGSLLHARASPEIELAYRPGLDRYYEQEGFSTHAWTKYANLGALGTVLAWAAREQHRRREDASRPSGAGNSLSRA